MMPYANDRYISETALTTLPDLPALRRLYVNGSIGRRTGPGEGAEAALKRISDAAQSTAAREAQP